MALGTEQDLDRNEAATPHKLSEARKKGQVAKSVDVVSTVVLLAGAVTLYAKGWEGLKGIFRFDRLLLSLANQQASSGTADGWVLADMARQMIRGGLEAVWPVMGVLLLAAILANIGQTGAVWTWHPVKPDWSRLNPANGFKRLFSVRALVDIVRALLKFVVVTLVVWAGVNDLMSSFGQLADVMPYAHANLLMHDMGALALRLGLAMGVLAILDFAYSHREFAKKMRMSRRELRDETKNREGDPRIRARLRELRREMLRRSLSIRRTAQADVVITNPTHIAIALQYRHGEMAAPVVVCKGAGALAAVMRAIAARHRVPVIRSPALARAIHAKTRIDSPVPAEHYAEVARLLVWVLSMKNARRTAEGSVA